MQLAEWLKSARRTHLEFAEDIGVTTSTVTRYVNGDRMPKREIMQRIQEITDGKVTPNDFFGVPEDDDMHAGVEQPVAVDILNVHQSSGKAA